MDMKEKKMISFLVYTYNNEKDIVGFLTFLIQNAEALFEQFEIIVINDCSTDNTVKNIKTATHLKDYQIAILQMSFHQGIELSMNAGLDLSIGDFVYEFDSTIIDFKENLIDDVYHKILEGYDIVVASPMESDHFTSKWFYKTYNTFSNSKYKLKTDRFRLLSRRAINRAFSISVTIPYRKAMYINSGLKIYDINYTKRTNEKKNREKTHLRNKTAVDALIIYTSISFKISLYIALALFLCTMSIVVYTLYIYFGKEKPIEGWTTIMLLLSGGFSGIFFLSSIVIKYLSLILQLVFKKKSYIHENIEKI